RDDERNERRAPSGAERPGETGSEPERQWRDDQIGGREHIHRQKEHQAAESGPGEIGEVDTSENPAAPEKDAAKEERARQERRQLGQEDLQKLPLLRRVG